MTQQRPLSVVPVSCQVQVQPDRHADLRACHGTDRKHETEQGDPLSVACIHDPCPSRRTLTPSSEVVTELTRRFVHLRAN
jgi:hypothetical protein